MALERAVGGIAIPTTVGADFSVTGLTFQPKVLLCWCNAQTTPSHQNSNARWGFGFAGDDGGTLTQGYVGGWDQDGVATTVGGATSGTGTLLRALSAVSTVDLELALLSFNSDGFTIDTVNPFATSGIILSYMALGGSDITAARVFSWNYTNTTPQDVTVNAGFGKPNLVLSQWSDTDIHPTAHTNAAARDPHYNMSVITNNGTTVEDGMSDGVSDRANAVQAMWLHQRMGRMISGVDNVPPLTYEAHADTNLANWPTDGFRVVKDLIGGSSPTSLPIVSLAVKGTFQAKLAEVSTSTTLNANVDMNAGFAPRAAFLFGGNLPAATTLRDADSGAAQALTWGVGAYDGTNQRSARVSGDDANASAQTGLSYSATRAWMSTDPDATLANPPILAGDSTASFSGNNVRLTQSDADTVARGVMVLALGDSAGGTTHPKTCTATAVGTASVSKSSSLTRLAVSTGVASALRTPMLAKTASGTGTATLVKTPFITKSATSVAVASLDALKLVVLTLLATATGAASLSKTTSKQLVATSTETVILSKQVTKTVLATAVGVASVVAARVIVMLLTAVSVGQANLSKVVQKALTSNVTGVATVTKSVGKVLQAVSVGTASLRKLIAKSVLAISTSQAFLTPLRIVAGSQPDVPYTLMLTGVGL